MAEKLEAMVSLGITNSRLKDFYDLHRLASLSTFDGAVLVRSIRATFERRKTPFPAGEPLALSPDFMAQPNRSTQWRAFLKRGKLEGPQSPQDLAGFLREFLLPVLAAAARDLPFDARWHPGGPWSSKVR